MNWLFPGFLAGGMLIGLPIALHFLRSRPKAMVRFPTLRFLGASAVRDTHRHRLRRWITLALRCLALGLLAAAFARPFWLDARATKGRVVVIAVDNSMSMQATDRWSVARDWGLNQLGKLQPGDHAGVLLMFPHPTWLVPITDDLVRVNSALLDAQPGYETTHYADALRIASEALAAHPAEAKTLLWQADEQSIGWLGMDLKKTLPAGIKILFAAPATAPARQAAIVSLRRGGRAGAEELQVTIRLYQPEPQRRHLTVLAGKKIVAQRDLTLQNGENEISIPISGGTSDGWRVALDSDDLPADDVAWIASAAATGSSVLLDKTAGADFLSHALRSTKRLGAGALEPGPLPASDWPTDAVVILRGSENFRPPLLERLNRFADAGGPLWIFIDGSPDPLAWLKAQGISVTERTATVPTELPWHLRDWDPEHPILAAFAGESLVPLLDVEFNKGFNLSGDALSPVANWPDGSVALAACNVHGHRLFLAGFPLDREATNWPVQPSLVPFVHQTVRWLGSLGGARGDWQVGESIPLTSDGIWRALDSPMSLPERKVSGSVRPTAPGLYEFVAGSSRRIFAVHVPPEESDLTPWPDSRQLAALESKEIAQPATSQTVLPLSHEIAENQQRFWWWLLAICGVALLAELALANRTSM